MTSPLAGEGDRAGKFRPSMVHVDRLYEVRCDAPECNENVGSEFYSDRADAEESRRVHIRQHRRDAALDNTRRGGAA